MSKEQIDQTLKLIDELIKIQGLINHQQKSNDEFIKKCWQCIIDRQHTIVNGKHFLSL